jgi:flagellar motor switch protein FliG
MTDIKNLSGGDKAAVLLLSLGETEAAAVLKGDAPADAS